MEQWHSETAGSVADRVLDMGPLGITVKFVRTGEETGGKLVEMEVEGRPRGDPDHAEPEKKRPPPPAYVKQRWEEGNQFNKDNRHRYPTNEVILDNKKVLDSYKPNEEIVSRKHTQISEIQPTTWQGYLNEHVTKYSPGETVKDSPSMREKYPNLVGEELSGQQYMEVPVQNNEVPEWAIRAANKLDVIIRDVTGHVYKLPREES